MFSTGFLTFVQLVLLILLSGYFTYDKAELLGEWESCPEQKTTLTGCNITVKAIFNIYQDPTCSQESHIKFGIHYEGSKIKTNTSKETSNGGCKVTVNGVIEAMKTGASTFNFHANKISVDSNSPTSLHCDLTVSDVPPLIITIDITCDGVKVKWEEPTVINSGSITVPDLEYTVTVQGTDSIVYNKSTSQQSLLIPYNSKGVGGLEYHKQYTVSVATTYCNGMTGNVSNESFYTAIEPQFVNHVISTSIGKSTHHITILNTLKIANPDCKVSYPDSTSTICISNLKCGSTQSLNDPLPFEVGNHGSVLVYIDVPVDATPCSVKLQFHHDHYSSPAMTTSFNITDNLQLQSCTIFENNHYIYVVCQFSKMSELWGCRAIAKANDKTVGQNYSYTSNNISAKDAWGKIEPADDNENYLVTCYGVTNDKDMVSYDNSPLYTAWILNFSAQGTNSSSTNVPATADSDLTPSTTPLPTIDNTSNTQNDSSPSIHMLRNGYGGRNLVLYVSAAITLLLNVLCSLS